MSEAINTGIVSLVAYRANELWVVWDAPTKEDVANYILNMADEAGQPNYL
jgi:hypothetical protein